MTYKYKNMFYTTEQITDGKLADMLETGWELVAMAPYRMVAGNGGTVVAEYLVTLRMPAVG